MKLRTQVRRNLLALVLILAFIEVRPVIGDSLRKNGGSAVYKWEIASIEINPFSKLDQDKDPRYTINMKRSGAKGTFGLSLRKSELMPILKYKGLGDDPSHIANLSFGSPYGDPGEALDFYRLFCLKGGVNQTLQPDTILFEMAKSLATGQCPDLSNFADKHSISEMTKQAFKSENSKFDDKFYKKLNQAVEAQKNRDRPLGLSLAKSKEIDGLSSLCCTEYFVLKDSKGMPVVKFALAPGDSKISCTTDPKSLAYEMSSGGKKLPQPLDQPATR